MTQTKGHSRDSFLSSVVVSVGTILDGMPI